MAISGDELRDTRSILSLTQAELANELGVSQRTIVSWERVGVPDKAEVKVLRAIGRTLYEVRRQNDYEEFLTTPAGQDELEAQWRAHEEGRGAGVDASFTGAYIHARSERDIALAADALSPYDDLTLLHELVRRQTDPENARLPELRRWYVDAQSDLDVGGRLQDDVSDDDFDVETDPTHDGLLQTDVGLAARRGKRKVDEPPAE